MGGPGSGAKRTFDTDKLRELVEQGKTSGEIAEHFGISRQRVHQVAKREGIQLSTPSLGRPHMWGKRDKQVSRIKISGDNHEISTKTSGCISEMLAAADLMARGWKVFFPINSHGHHDIVAAKGDMLKSFEVRSGTKNKDFALRFRRDKELRSDFYAVVIRDGPVEYEPDLPD